MSNEVLRNLRKSDGVDPEEQKLVNELSGLPSLTKEAIFEANRVITKEAGLRADLKGMGSTIETLCIKDGDAVIGYVGDSRVYRQRMGFFMQLTEDYSLLNEELKCRKMTPEEIQNIPFKNRIIRALGHLSDHIIDIHIEPVERGDIFLLCSDGLTDVVSSDVIHQTLNDCDGDPESACRKLVNMANEGGGPDNISVIIVIIT